jgi:hypothetical protein
VVNRTLQAAVAVAALIVLQAIAQAATVAGVQLRPVIRWAGEELVLTSCGVRDTLWIEHYVAGLYVPRGTRAVSAVRDPNKSKVLVVQVLNTYFFPPRLPEKWRKPLQASLSADKFAQVSAAYQNLLNGDTMQYSYSPDTGLAMTVNGERVINAGHGVIDALLRAWQRDEDPGTLGELLQGNNC